jgi:hypothetical protein
VSLDHEAYLGDRVELIAAEKAGIIKPGALAVTARQDPQVEQLLRAHADATMARLLVEDRDFALTRRRTVPVGQVITVSGLAARYDDVPLALHGRHQAHNAAVAIACVEALLEDALPRDSVYRALGRVESPGRLDVLPGESAVVLDAAHNPDGARALASALSDLGSGRTVGVGASDSPQATLLPLEEVPNVLGYQDGVDNMDHAVVGRNIADYACPLIVAPAQDQLAPGHRGGDFAALHRLDFLRDCVRNQSLPFDHVMPQESLEHIAVLLCHELVDGALGQLSERVLGWSKNRERPVPCQSVLQIGGLDRLGEGAELIPALYLFQNVRSAGCSLAGCSLTDLLIDALVHHRACSGQSGSIRTRTNNSGDQRGSAAMQAADKDDATVVPGRAARARSGHRET